MRKPIPPEGGTTNEEGRNLESSSLTLIRRTITKRGNTDAGARPSRGIDHGRGLRRLPIRFTSGDGRVGLTQTNNEIVVDARTRSRGGHRFGRRRRYRIRRRRPRRRALVALDLRRMRILFGGARDSLLEAEGHRLHG